MDVTKVLAELQRPRKQVDVAILSLERLSSSQSRHAPHAASMVPIKRRGRPPGSKNKVTARSGVNDVNHVVWRIVTGA